MEGLGINDNEWDRVATDFSVTMIACVATLIMLVKRGLKDMTHTINMNCRRLPVS